MKKILFVCLGNICRSPMAEAIFNDKVRKLGIGSSLIADSAGTAGYHIGEAPDPRSVATIEKHGIEISHRGQQFIRKHGILYDYIVAMDSSNKKNILLELDGENTQKVLLMRDFDPVENGDVPDPYYGGNSGFDNVFRILDRSIEQFISQIQKEHNE